MSRPPSPGEPTSRPFRPDDRAACLAVFDSNVPEYFSADEREEFATFLDDPPGPYRVFDDPESGVVACGGHALADDGRRADMCWGMVRADLHRNGFGRRLTRERIDAALASPGVIEIALNTSQHTVDFYRRLGFVLESVERDGYSRGLDRCEMRLRRSAVSA